jgi:hypothetical protein
MRHNIAKTAKIIGVTLGTSTNTTTADISNMNIDGI